MQILVRISEFYGVMKVFHRKECTARSTGSWQLPVMGACTEDFYPLLSEGPQGNFPLCAMSVRTRYYDSKLKKCLNCDVVVSSNRQGLC